MESLSKSGTTTCKDTDGKCSHNKDDCFVNEMKEYFFNRVFTPSDSQTKVYMKILLHYIQSMIILVKITVLTTTMGVINKILMKHIIIFRFFFKWHKIQNVLRDYIIKLTSFE